MRYKQASSFRIWAIVLNWPLAFGKGGEQAASPSPLKFLASFAGDWVLENDRGETWLHLTECVGRYCSVHTHCMYKSDIGFDLFWGRTCHRLFSAFIWQFYACISFNWDSIFNHQFKLHPDIPVHVHPRPWRVCATQCPWGWCSCRAGTCQRRCEDSHRRPLCGRMGRTRTAPESGRKWRQRGSWTDRIWKRFIS